MTIEQEVFILSEQRLARVIDEIRGEQWEEMQPDWFTSARRERHSLRTIVNYHAYDSAWVPDVLDGRTIEEVGSRYDGDLLGDDPSRGYRVQSERAVEAVRVLDNPDKIVHLTYGDWPAREYLKHTSSFRAFHAHDIALWIGADARLPDDLVRGLWEVIAPEAEEWRKLGVYGPAVPVPEDAPLQDRLLGLVGRDPSVLS